MILWCICVYLGIFVCIWVKSHTLSNAWMTKLVPRTALTTVDLLNTREPAVRQKMTTDPDLVADICENRF